MLSDKLKKLAAGRQRVAALEKSIASELKRELASLPAQYGFDGVSSFLSAVEEATGVKHKAGRGRPKGSRSGKPRRKRSVITDATRAKVKILFNAGKTGEAIAQALDISLPSVQNIKKALGLVKSRK